MRATLDGNRSLRSLAICVVFILTGCGTTDQRNATEQLILSDAVDRSVAKLDFRALYGKKIFLDTQYVKAIKGQGFVNADYIVSSVRQQMVASGCLLQEKVTDAEIVAEVRVGTLGADARKFSFGIPSNKAISEVSTFVPNAPPIPVFPELSIARRDDLQGAAKIGVFAYDRESREPVWQSGLSHAESSSREMWVMGAGPFKRGTIHEEILIFDGFPLNKKEHLTPAQNQLYYSGIDFREPKRLPVLLQGQAVQLATHEDQVKEAESKKEVEPKPAPPAESSPAPIAKQPEKSTEKKSSQVVPAAATTPSTPAKTPAKPPAKTAPEKKAAPAATTEGKTSATRHQTQQWVAQNTRSAS